MSHTFLEKVILELGLLAKACISALRRLKQEDWKFKPAWDLQDWSKKKARLLSLSLHLSTYKHNFDKLKIQNNSGITYYTKRKSIS